MCQTIMTGKNRKKSYIYIVIFKIKATGGFAPYGFVSKLTEKDRKG